MKKFMKVIVAIMSLVFVFANFAFASTAEKSGEAIEKVEETKTEEATEEVADTEEVAETEEAEEATEEKAEETKAEETEEAVEEVTTSGDIYSSFEATEVKWEDFEDSMSGEFVQFPENGFEMFLPSIFESVELTQNDRDNYYIGYYTTSFGEDAEVPAEAEEVAEDETEAEEAVEGEVAEGEEAVEGEVAEEVAEGATEETGLTVVEKAPEAEIETSVLAVEENTGVIALQYVPGDQLAVDMADLNDYADMFTGIDAIEITGIVKVNDMEFLTYNIPMLKEAVMGTVFEDGSILEVVFTPTDNMDMQDIVNTVAASFRTIEKVEPVVEEVEEEVTTAEEETFVNEAAETKEEAVETEEVDETEEVTEAEEEVVEAGEAVENEAAEEVKANN